MDDSGDQTQPKSLLSQWTNAIDNKLQLVFSTLLRRRDKQHQIADADNLMYNVFFLNNF